MRKALFVLIILVLSLTSIPSVNADNPLDNITVVQDLPDALVAGNTYIMIITFDNVAPDTINFAVEVTVDCIVPLGYNEVFINLTLNNDVLTCVESSPGFYESSEDYLPKQSSNILKIKVRTAVNLQPETYSFTFDLLAEEYEPEPLPTPTPAEFIVMELAVSPSTVHPGDNVAVRVVLANVGGEAGEHELELLINGIFVASESVALGGGESTTVTFTVVREDVGVYLVEVHGLQVSFTVILEPIPAEFIITDLAISPSTVHPGDNVTVGVVLANVGEEAGEYTVELLINGDFEASEPIMLGGGESTTVTFTVAREVVGVYLVDVDGLQGSFMVVVEPPELPPFLDNLTITPAELVLGDEVTISLDIMNPNDHHFGFIVTMKIGELTLLVDSDMEAYESKTLSRTITPSIIGVYNVTVDGMSGNFTVIPEVPPIPAEFEYSNLSIAPTEVELGELVNVSVTVTNVGELEGTCDVSLLVNGTVESVESVTLDGGEVVDVIFTLTAGEPGTYIVSVDGLEGSFTVVAPPDLTPYLVALLIIVSIIVLFRRKIIDLL